MHQQALGLQSDPRRDECLGRHAHGARHGAVQALVRAVESLGIVGHLVPLCESFLHQLLEAPETLQCRGCHRLLALLPAVQDAQTGQQRMDLVAQQRVHVIMRGVELRVCAHLLDRTDDVPQFLATQGQVPGQPLQIDRELEAARRAGDR